MRFHNQNGHYELHSLPGCNQLVVSNHVFIKPDRRGLGLGTLEAHDRIQLAKDMGYDYMICTVVQDNVPQLRIMEKLAWVKLAEWRNSVTDNMVGIYGHDLDVADGVTDAAAQILAIADAA